MNSMISVLCVAALLSSAAAGPLFPYRFGLGGVSSYYYSGAPLVRPVAPYAAAPIAPVPAAAVVPDYYSYAASAALAYPGYGYGYPYYAGAYAGYPYIKK